MKRLILVMSFILIGCDSNRVLKIPVISQNSLNEINTKVRELGFKIKNIDEEKVLSKLERDEAFKFRKRLRKLKKNYNKTSNLIRENYKLREKEELELEYSKTLTIWNYIVKNYRI